jgi:hypothetical protein
MEALAKARELDDVKFPTVITCPHEVGLAIPMPRVEGLFNSSSGK